MRIQPWRLRALDNGPRPWINALRRDGRGRMWISTNKGVLGIEPSALASSGGRLLRISRALASNLFSIRFLSPIIAYGPFCLMESAVCLRTRIMLTHISSRSQPPQDWAIFLWKLLRLTVIATSGSARRWRRVADCAQWIRLVH
jgi:hypothetical protein